MMCIIKKKHVRFTAKEKKKEDKMNILKKFVNHAHFYAKHAILF